MPIPQRMVVELAAPLMAVQGLTRAEWIGARRLATQEVKRQVLARIEQIRHVDLDLQLLAQESLFPVLLVRGTQQLFDALGQLPEVVRITSEQQGELL